MKQLISVCFLLLAAGPVLARGGGGCFEAGTPVDTPSGPIAIERLVPGDAVWAVRDGRRVAARVQNCVRVHPDYYLEIETADRRIHVTPEHPFLIAAGVFRTAQALRPGDTLYLWDHDSLVPISIRTIATVPAGKPAFNLTVLPGATFLAGGIAVHNKGGGCFLGDTPVLKADGSAVPIRRVRAGDNLRAFTPAGAIVTTTVRRCRTHIVREYAIVTTPSATIRVTREHPFFVGGEMFRTLDVLVPGDAIFVLDNETLRPEAIVSVRWVRARTRVYNLETDAPHTYFAAGAAVHNKGGGGGGHGGGGFGGGGFGGGGTHFFHTGHGHGHNDADWILWIILGGTMFGMIVFIVIMVSNSFKAKTRSTGPDLDFIFARPAVDARAARTEKLLDYLRAEAPEMEPQHLRDVAEQLFVKLQKCWQEREYEAMETDLMPTLYAEHLAQLKSMRRNHEINRIEFPQVEHLAIIHVHFARRADRCEFSALITAKARDYYVDDRTNAFLRGDSVPTRFQEFWTFQRQGDRWLLRDIEQSKDSDLLETENVVETLNDDQLKEIDGGSAPMGAVAGPWLENAAALKQTRIERLLNFLAQRDRIWDRKKMLERARQVFLDVVIAQESGAINDATQAELFPNIVEDLGKEIRKRQDDGLALEFRNLCIRKVELILVRNYNRDDDDEFTVRVRAHAQKVLRRGETVVSQDPAVTPFEQYWTFGRQSNAWKLKEVLPAMQGRQMIAAENVDEDSTREQIEWYYTQTHA